MDYPKKINKQKVKDAIMKELAIGAPKGAMEHGKAVSGAIGVNKAEAVGLIDNNLFIKAFIINYLIG